MKKKEMFDLDCIWHCDECDAILNDQDGFTCENGIWICTECGFENSVTEDDIIYDTGWDDEEDEIPEGCSACGGDYPHCKDSCPMFDD